MSIKLISFDLQGTLCDHAFSNEVWLTLLPKVFEVQRSILSPTEHSQLLRDFENIGQDDWRYYDLNYWLRRAGSKQTASSLAKLAANRPRIFPKMKELVETLIAKVPIIILSATTQEFISLELGHWSGPFSSILSTADDFRQPGKPPGIFSSISKERGLSPNECLHIGDHKEMDGVSPKQAGWQSIYDPPECPPAKRAKRTLDHLAGA